jgi:SAM-dependent methyltransferase
METYTASTYGDRIAEFYDERHRAFDEESVRLLAELAGGGRALELGVGTGRLALPLAARGVEVHGIDASRAMVERLRAKPGGGDIHITFGDFEEVAAPGEFALVYVVFNTFFALLSQESQVRCFQNVAARLAPGGVFLIEAFVPNPARLAGGQTTSAAEVTTERAVLDISRHDRARQYIDGQTVVLTDGRVRLYPIQLRFAWPSELDLMARLAGLRLRERRGGWSGEEFNAESTLHVSVYERGE